MRRKAETLERQRQIKLQEEQLAAAHWVLPVGSRYFGF